MIIVKEHPTIVCLCGSTRFKKEFEQVNADLTMRGFIVLSAGLFSHADGLQLSADDKAMLDELHKRKIDLADEIFVVNVGGYIGESTQNEIRYAIQQKKLINFLEN